MKEYIKPNIKVCEVSVESLLAGSLGATDSLPSGSNPFENQFSKKKGSTSLWDYDDLEEEEENE